MSYHNPYAHHGQASSGHQHYNDSVTDFNSYATNPFEQNDGWNNNSYPSRPLGSDLQQSQGLTVEPNRRSVSGFDHGEFTPKEK
jgi:hypothetical protein